MEAKRIRYPIGIQTFRNIVEGGYLYIDKTGLVHDLGENYKYVFLSRPRRFGKSLLSSTIHSYFAGEEELFKGLKAGELKKEWAKHPVFHFDMSTAKHLNEEQLLRTISYKLEEYEITFGKDDHLSEDDIHARFERLIKVAVEQAGEKAVIIIDEYDSPLLDVMNDKERLAPMRQIMRNFYSPIKSLDPYLRFVFITGITKFAQLSIFSELNNLMNISMLPEYSAICGISGTEIDNRMREPIQALAERLNIQFEEARLLLKENYDGYHFCEGSEDIYNPFSLMKALAARKIGSYWFESGTPTFLFERLRMNPIDETTLDCMPLIPESDFDVSPEISDNSLPMLYQTGYLTIKEYDRDLHLYTLGYPNKEVKIGFTQGLLAQYKNQEITGSGFVAQFYASMYRHDIDKALSLMQSYLAGIPYDLENKSEKHFQTIIYLIFSLLGYYTQAEVKSAIGRADAVCRTKDRIYIFEFKVDGSTDEALRQIDEKGALIPYRFEGAEGGKAASAAESVTKLVSEPIEATGLTTSRDASTGSVTETSPATGRLLVKVGVNISTQTRTIESWKVVLE